MKQTRQMRFIIDPGTFEVRLDIEIVWWIRCICCVPAKNGTSLNYGTRGLNVFLLQCISLQSLHLGSESVVQNLQGKIEHSSDELVYLSWRCFYIVAKKNLINNTRGKWKVCFFFLSFFWLGIWGLMIFVDKISICRCKQNVRWDADMSNQETYPKSIVRSIIPDSVLFSPLQKVQYNLVTQTA